MAEPQRPPSSATTGGRRVKTAETLLVQKGHGGSVVKAGGTNAAKQFSSALLGVSRKGKKWQAQIRHGGDQVKLGHYDSQEEAACAWDKAAVLLRPHDGIQLNYPLQDYLDAQNRPLPDPRIEALLRGDPDDPALAGITAAGKQLTSAFTGVSRMRKKWKAQITRGGTIVWLGLYDSEEEAARTWDKAAVLFRPHDGIKLNYPLQDYLDAQGRPLPEPRIEALLRGVPDDPALAGVTKSGKKVSSSSAFRGVSRERKKWQAAISRGGKLRYLGQYNSEEEAARTWDMAAVLTRPHDGKLKLNYPLQDYLDDQDKPLSHPRIEALLRGVPDDPELAGKS